MSASNFRPSLALVLAHEGGYVNHPADPGGPTNKGVTQAVYDAYRRYSGSPIQTVRNITAEETAEIYQKQYWKLIRGDSLPCGLDYAVFDFGVNSGVSRAVKYLQRLVGVPDDAVIGNQTLAAIEVKARQDEEALIAQYCANRMAFLRSLGTFHVFGLGWTRRVIGAQTGVQANDTGVIDFATMMARRTVTYAMPSSIGSLPNEVAAKAVSVDPEQFPVSVPVNSVVDAKAKLRAENDALADIIKG